MTQLFFQSFCTKKWPNFFFQSFCTKKWPNFFFQSFCTKKWPNSFFNLFALNENKSSLFITLRHAKRHIDNIVRTTTVCCFPFRSRIGKSQLCLGVPILYFVPIYICRCKFVPLYMKHLVNPRITDFKRNNIGIHCSFIIYKCRCTWFHTSKSVHSTWNDLQWPDEKPSEISFDGSFVNNFRKAWLPVGKQKKGVHVLNIFFFINIHTSLIPLLPPLVKNFPKKKTRKRKKENVESWFSMWPYFFFNLFALKSDPIFFTIFLH